MDRDEALKLLNGREEGIGEWNRRRLSADRIPELQNVRLSFADLSKANLSEINLHASNLSVALLMDANLEKAHLALTDLKQASLNRANLSHASLNSADLLLADLSEANLSGARLGNANLTTASLRRANLIGADLAEAILTGAFLEGADFSRTSCRQTMFANVDLSAVNGLDSVRHDGPSTIGIDTIVKSKGRIPEVFLRGCGVPETVIQSIPMLINSMEPIQFYSCFISYNTKNQDFVERLHADLQAKGVRTWFDRSDLKIGDKIRHGINEAIRIHDKLMLVLSEHSIASDWVEGEVEAALERERREKRTVLFPIRLDDAIVDTPTGWASHIRQTRHIGDFRGWENHTAYKNAFARLLRDLKSVESTGAGAHTPPVSSP